MKQIVYADNAATTQLDKSAYLSMINWLTDEYGNASQLYSFSHHPKIALSDARITIAQCINAEPCEIYFTSGGTESDNWVIKGSALSDEERKLTVTSAFEHHAILNSCKTIEAFKYPVLYLQPNSEGYIIPNSLNSSISANVRLVSIMYANNEIGTIQPIQELCRVSHEYGALFHTDAVQAVGHIKIDVKKLGIDMLSASAHKFYGPKGIGFLYLRKGTKIAPFIDGGAQEMDMRAGTENVASIVGMAEALRINCEKIEENNKHIRALEQQLIYGLNNAGIKYKRNGGECRLPGIINLSFAGKDGEAILHRMDLMGISISTGAACNSVHTQISHVLKAIQLDENLAKGTVRISLGKNNTSEEIDKIVQALIKILS